MKSLDVKLTTTDGLDIAGTYIPGSLPFGVVFMHMMPAVKESYAELAEKFAEAGFHTMAIDFRGHGQSGGGDYNEFTNEDHQKYALDLEAAIEYLRKQSSDIKIGLVGASIGANIAVQYAVSNPTVFLILLSPGLNYRDVNAGEAIQKLPVTLPIYFVAALDDGRVPGNSSQTETLYNTCSSSSKTIQVFQSGGHGTQILEGNPELVQRLLSWAKDFC